MLGKWILIEKVASACNSVAKKWALQSILLKTKWILQSILQAILFKTKWIMQSILLEKVDPAVDPRCA